MALEAGPVLTVAMLGACKGGWEERGHICLGPNGRCSCVVGGGGGGGLLLVSDAPPYSPKLSQKERQLGSLHAWHRGRPMVTAYRVEPAVRCACSALHVPQGVAAPVH